jgi:ElaB/YqjD/DUF883 family membrane-anchored ribosome-binding protein
MTDKWGSGSESSMDLTSLRNDLSRLSETVAQLVRGQTDGAADAMRDTAQHLQQSGRALASDAQTRLRGWTSDLESSIERNPLTAVMVAAGIGLLVGLMRRDRD